MRLIKHIKASNLLSFGPDGLDLELHDLNVLIGANGSGKSNFLEIFELLRALPKGEEDANNLYSVISRGGGFSEWTWKGDKGLPNIFIEATLGDTPGLIHGFQLNMLIYLELEYINSEKFLSESGNVTRERHITFYRKDLSKNISVWNAKTRKSEKIKPANFSLSILSQRINNSQINHIVHELEYAYERIRIYREWSFGRNTIFRLPQRADLRNDRLESDFSNLGIFLSRLRKDPATKRVLITALQDLYEGLTDFEIVTEGGTVQIFFTEGDFSIPATRLSDGTLRYLCLLALLLDPTPPPLICIEEPELGLHPDVLPKIADLLIEASKRTQLIVTTHSDVLIDALSQQPESVLVFEKEDGQTKVKRLNNEDLKHWLSDYSLGQLWLRGEIGGKRW